MLAYFPELKRNATLKANADGEYVDGEYVPGADIETPIKIILPQPVKADELVFLPGGEEIKNWLRTWIDKEIVVKIRSGKKDSNEIIFNGVTFKNIQIDDRTDYGGFYRVFIKQVFNHA